MICDEAAEYVSALCDGETISRDAAEHIGDCENCRAQLRDYLETGAELRRVASLEALADIPRVVWAERGRTSRAWWQRGWERMSIPRLVFASLVFAVVGLASSLAVVGVRAKSEGTVMMLRISTAPGASLPCPLSAVDSKRASCGFVGAVKGGMLIYKVDFLSKDNDRVELAVRSKVVPAHPGSHSYSPFDLDASTEKRYWFEAGETLQIDAAGGDPIVVTGEWMDHMPTPMAGNREVDPKAGELRMNSPLLLKGSEVIGDQEGGLVSVDKPGQGVMIYWPGLGRYVVSLSAMEGAVQADVKLNRLSFQIDGQKYVFVTGTPIARSATAWVRFEPNYKPSPDSGNGFIGSLDVNALENRSVEDR
jgi:hypothetical protein